MSLACVCGSICVLWEHKLKKTSRGCPPERDAGRSAGDKQQTRTLTCSRPVCGAGGSAGESVVVVVVVVM